jgi:putative phage-type endonuclease
MQIINCEQGSEEWLNIRRGVATASNFSKIVTSKGEISKQLADYAFQLASESFTDLQDESYKSSDMQRGNDLEPEARNAYQQETLSLVKEVGFMMNDYYGYSPDGLVGNDGLVEFKCPNQKTHTKYLYKGVLPTEYKAQVQGGLLVSERKWCDFVSFHPNFIDSKKLFIIRVFRDEEFIEQLSNGLAKLWLQLDAIRKIIASNY